MQPPPHTRTLKRGRDFEFGKGAFFRNSSEGAIGTGVGIAANACSSRIQNAEEQLIETAGGKEVSLIVCVHWRQNGSKQWHETFCKSHLQALAEFGGQLVEGRCHITYKLVPSASMENQRAMQMHRRFKASTRALSSAIGKDYRDNPYFLCDTKEEFVARMEASVALSSLRKQYP